MSDISFPPLTATYVNGGLVTTVAQLLSSTPPSANVVGMYARVSDLYGSVDDILRCRFDGTSYRWVPQRESFAGTTAVTEGNIPITPLITPPTLRMIATVLSANVSITPSSTNAYFGQRARIIAPSSLPVSTYVIQVMGLIGSNINLLAGKTTDIEFGATGWFQSV